MNAATQEQATLQVLTGPADDNENRDELGDLAEQINEHHRQYERSALATIEHARAAGDALLTAKGKVRHGDWLEWLTAPCDINERTSQRYMRVARNWAKLTFKSDTMSDLTINDGLKLLAGPSALDSSESSEWYPPPPKIITAVQKVLGTIDLDPVAHRRFHIQSHLGIVMLHRGPQTVLFYRIRTFRHADVNLGGLNVMDLGGPAFRR